MDEDEIEQKINDGWVRVNVIFEVVGNPKEHVEESLQEYMDNIKGDEKLQIIEEETEEAKEVDDGLYSTFTEADMLVDGLEKLNWLCYNFSPASVEIVEPANFKFHASELQNWINDYLAKLHEVGQVSKQISSEKKLLARNMNRLIKNGILICLSNGIDTPQDIEEALGIPHKQLKPFFQALVDEGKIQLHDDQYERIDTKEDDS